MNQAATFGSTRPIIPAGTQLNGIYEIDEPIAAGGMGEIYKGHAIQTGDPVAIKLIRTDLAEAEAAFALFRKEASALHNLYHEAIVRYYVFTIDPVLERPYLAMEFVDGQSLSAMLRGGPLAFEAVHRLMQRIAAGLHAAHERGIIHRDVSPDNIIIPAGDMAKAKIIDFGIARSTRLDDEGTIIGSGFAGKYNYVSPEQLGLFGGEVTPKSDIYSLGLVLAEALRNGPIDMGGNHVDVIDKRRVVPDVGPIDPRLRPLIETMLQPNPEDRPASMADVAAWPVNAVSARGATGFTTATGAFGQGASGHASSGQGALGHGISGAATKLATAGRVPALLAGGGALALLAVGAGLFMMARTPPRNVPPPPVLTEESGSYSPAPESSAETSPSTRSPPGSSPAQTDARPAASVTAGKIAKPAEASASSGGAVKPGLAPMNLAKLELWPMRDPGDAADSVQRARLQSYAQFLSQYDGGDCFFARPLLLSDGAAAVEGFGSSTLAVQSLDQAFREKGLDVDIGARQVSAGQCPAITFLGRLRGATDSAPNLEIAASTLTLGQPLAGTISGLNGRQADVLVVSSDGSTRSLPLAPIEGRDDAMSFSFKTGSDLADGRLQLVVAIAGSKPISALRANQQAAAVKIFSQIIAEAEKSNLTLAAAVRSFKVEK
ncbi:serine/threonine-protein kinase [Methylocapsa palsarum]|uniref:Serine/threonine protein kinase n=1 Tax=Methylocapsa palsarum TaxID=1612308 RepID=A0A1I3YNM0_9HYPH|nr:serine/threonine-protein kinase [Methylocapsa palsarum]SFK33412.1 serine/threonine protein kinase [Methylocapsa palsarum]